MVLLSNITDIVSGNSSATQVYNATSNMQLGFPTELDFTPAHHMNYLRGLKDTVAKSTEITADGLITMKEEGAALAQQAKMQAAVFKMIEDRANTHVDMIKNESGHQLRLIQASSKLAQVQRGAISGAADLAQGNAMSYAPYKGKMNVMTRSINSAYSLL